MDQFSASNAIAPDLLGAGSTPHDNSQGSDSADIQDATFEPTESEFVDYGKMVAQTAASMAASSITILPEGCSKGQAISLLSNRIPLTETGLPAMFYRSDMLPYPLSSLSDQDIEAATVHLDYSEGYPQFQDGHLFWGQLPHETHQSYLLFQRYLDQGEELGIRQLQLLAAGQHLPLSEVADAAKEYYWSQRARSYDLFVVAADEKRRQARIRKSENKHYETTDKLFDAVVRLFDNPEYIEELSPAQALEALDTLVRVKRQSLGLIGQFASSIIGGGRKGVSDATAFKEVARGANEGGGAIGISTELKELMASDPKFAFQAQQLILQMHTSHDVAGTPEQRRLPGQAAGDEG